MHYFIFLLGTISVTFAVPAPHNPMENGGLFDGDIFFPNWDGDRNAIPRDVQRWPGGIVPFVIAHQEGEFEEVVVKNIRTAMRLIMSKTCIRFVMREAQKDHIKIFKGTGCWSFVGRNGGEQKLSLEDGCGSVQTITHELLHAVGFHHEHNRPDRDDYLNINWPAIKKEWYYAFNKLQPEQTRIITPFDFDSIMLYGSNDFVKEYGLWSMTDKHGKYVPDIYEKSSGMSESDIRRVNILYDCSDEYIH